MKRQSFMNWSARRDVEPGHCVKTSAVPTGSFFRWRLLSSGLIFLCIRLWVLWIRLRVEIGHKDDFKRRVSCLMLLDADFAMAIPAEVHCNLLYFWYFSSQKSHFVLGNKLAVSSPD